MLCLKLRKNIFWKMTNINDQVRIVIITKHSTLQNDEIIEIISYTYTVLCNSLWRNDATWCLSAVNIGSCNGLSLVGAKPLSAPVATQLKICQRMAFQNLIYAPQLAIKLLITPLEHHLSALLQHLHFRLNTGLQWIGRRQLQDETRNI